jgi:hypothetical protein
MAQARCALCGAKEISEPKGDERYCRDCWDKKIAVEEIVAGEFGRSTSSIIRPPNARVVSSSSWTTATIFF